MFCSTFFLFTFRHWLRIYRGMFLFTNVMKTSSAVAVIRYRESIDVEQTQHLLGSIARHFAICFIDRTLDKSLL